MSLFAKGDPKLGVYRSCGWLRVYQLTITKMVEGGTERDRSMRRVTPKPITPNHPGSYKETDCLVGVLATSIEDRDCHCYIVQNEGGYVVFLQWPMGHIFTVLGWGEGEIY